MENTTVTGKKKSGKSGEIELLRFIAALSVLFFHLNKHVLGRVTFPGSKWGFFNEAVTGVEFFFLCSGFLMAHSAYKEYSANPLPDDKTLGKSVSSFLYRKVMAFLPYHIIAFVLAWITVTVIDWKGVAHAVYSAIESIPSFFLIHMSGLKMENPQFVEWYLSVMVLGMLILYPIIRKRFHVFTRVIAPAAGIFILGYMYHKYHVLGDVKSWDVISFKAMLRGVAELCLGAFTFEVVRILKDKINVEKIKVLNTIIYVGGIIVFILFSCRKLKGHLNQEYQFLAVPLFMLIIAVCFLGGTCFSNALNNKVVMFLGKFSLPLYLAQVVGISIAESKLLPKSMGGVTRFVIGVVISLVTALIVMWIGDAIKRCIDRKKTHAPYSL